MRIKKGPKGFTAKRFSVLLFSVLLIFSYANMSEAANLFSYDPEWRGEEPKIGGYVDVYWTYSDNYDAQFNALGAEKTDFTVDRWELFVQHKIEDWAEGYYEISITSLSDDTEINLDEAYLQADIPWGNGLRLTGGRFDVPIGIGPNENIDIWNWQFKMTNLMVVPWAFTGGMAQYSWGDIDSTFWLANGWGYSEPYGFAITGYSDPDYEKTYGGRLGWSPEGLFNTGISVVTGNEDRGTAAGLQRRTLVDVDFCMEKLPDWLNALDLELWWMEVEDTEQAGTGLLDDSDAVGGVVQFNFQTKWESLSVSVAYEIIDEEDSIVFGGNPLLGWAIQNQTRQSLEITPIFCLGDNVIFVPLSWRGDWSNKDIFEEKDGGADDLTWLVASEWYYYF